MDSVLGQDHPDLELLVMDDGSTDDTPQVLDEYSRRYPIERFRFVRHENMGQARTLNRGYEAARGDVLGYLSDDDLLSPGAISRLIAELVADPEAVCVYPGYRMIDGTGQIVDTIRPIEYSPADALRLHDTIIGPGGLVRRGVLEASGSWDPSLRWMGDLILWMNVGLLGRVVRVPEPLASWRRHPGATTVELGLEHAREHLRLVDIGASLLGLPADEIPIRAEALRNACITGAFFGGVPDSATGERFVAADLHRAEISAFAAGLGRGDLLDHRADEATGLLRELARCTMEVLRLNSKDVPGAGAPGSGLESATRLLRAAGALPMPDGRFASVAPTELRTSMMVAAVECGADLDPDTSRYVLVDRGDRVPAEDDEVTELMYCTFRASTPRIRAAIEARRRELESLRS